MSNSVRFLFQLALKAETPKWLAEAIQAMVRGDNDKIVELSGGGLDQFFKRPGWEYLLTSRTGGWHTDNVPTTLFQPMLDADGKLLYWYLFGASSVEGMAWDLAWEFTQMISPWVAQVHELTPVREGEVYQPFMLAQDRLDAEGKSPKLTGYYKLNQFSVYQHGTRGDIEYYTTSMDLLDPWTWTAGPYQGTPPYHRLTPTEKKRTSAEELNNG